MPKLIIDGIEVEAPEGYNVIQAADLIGIHVPHFCYHHTLMPVGQCRICLVEVAPGPPKLQIACATTVKDGMEVKTSSDRVRKARAAVMEFLLINHPLDCPECDQAGECPLQDYAAEYGQGFSRFEETKRTYPRDIYVGEKLVRIQDRCIHCTRCIRFFRYIVGEEVMLAQKRGFHTDIMPLYVKGGTLDTNYSGNMAELCPCGALTTRDFRFKTRPWNLASSDSICPLCSTGCNIEVDHKQRKVYRIRPRVNMDVNTWWICDFGRFDFKYLNDDKRLAAPRVDGREVEWPAALDAAAAAIKTAPAGTLAAVCSASITNEEAYLLKKLLQALGTENLDHKLNDNVIDPSERQDNLLLRTDKNANTRGVRALGLTGGTSGAALAAKIAEGAIKTLILLDPSRGTLAAEIDALSLKVENIIVIDILETGASSKAKVVLPGAAFTEKSGTLTNHAGKVQRLSVAMPPPGKARAQAEILVNLAQRLGVELKYDSDIEVFNEIKDTLLKIEEQVTTEQAEKEKTAEPAG